MNLLGEGRLGVGLLKSGAEHEISRGNCYLIHTSGFSEFVEH